METAPADPFGQFHSRLRETTLEAMVVEYIRYQVASERHAEFLSAYAAAASELRASPECLRWDVSQGVEEPDHFIVRIEWESVEAHEQGFRKSAAFASFFVKVKPFFAEIVEMKHYRLEARGNGASA